MARNQLKNSIFQNRLITHPKVENAWNKCLFHHFGGMLALKSGLHFFVSASEVPLFGTWKRALLAKVPIFKCQKMGLLAPESKNGDHFFTQTSPKNGGLHICFVRLSLLGGFWANFEKLIFWTVLEPFSQQHSQKTKLARKHPKERLNQKV